LQICATTQPEHSLGGISIHKSLATIQTESLHLGVDRGILTHHGGRRVEESDLRVPTSLSMRERSDAEV
jgi:hypothetical protein